MSGKKISIDPDPIAAELVDPSGRYEVSEDEVFHNREANPAYILHMSVCPHYRFEEPGRGEVEHARRWNENRARVKAD